MGVNPLQNFLHLAVDTPAERNGRYFRAWQKVSVRTQRKVRSLVAQNFFSQEQRVLADTDLAYTFAVYASCQPCYGRRPAEFTYDINDVVALNLPLRLIGRSMKVHLAEIAASISDPRLKRRFQPVWHVDIVKAVRKQPRTLIEMLARESTMISSLIDLGTVRTERAEKRFAKHVESASRVLGLETNILYDAVLRAGAEYLADSRILEDSDELAAGSPEDRVSGDEDSDDRGADGCGQMADAGIVPDVHACS